MLMELFFTAIKGLNQKRGTYRLKANNTFTLHRILNVNKQRKPFSIK